MKILVGVPVFRVPSLVRSCLASLLCTPADVMAVDNCADADVKAVLTQFSRTIVVNAPQNEFCNGGWNRIMQYGLEHGYDLIGLGSSDVVLHYGWYHAVQKRAELYHNEVWLPTTTCFSEEIQYADAGIAGFFSFLPRKAVELVYPIPAGLRHWFGDQYMFEKLRRNGWKVGTLSAVRASHEQSSITMRTPEAYEVIEQDKLAWEEYENQRTRSNQETKLIF